MKITFNEELRGVHGYELKVGDVVEVLEDKGLKGHICMVTAGDGLREHFTDLKTGLAYFPPMEWRCRLLKAELIVRAYEGEDRKLEYAED